MKDFKIGALIMINAPEEWNPATRTGIYLGQLEYGDSGKCYAYLSLSDEERQLAIKYYGRPWYHISTVTKCELISDEGL